MSVQSMPPTDDVYIIHVVTYVTQLVKVYGSYWQFMAVNNSS